MFQTIKDKSYIPEPAPLEIEEPKSQVKPEPESPTKKPAESRRPAASQRGRDKENDTKVGLTREQAFSQTRTYKFGGVGRQRISGSDLQLVFFSKFWTRTFSKNFEKSPASFYLQV